MNKRFVIKKAIAVEPYYLTVTFGDDEIMTIDLNNMVTNILALSPLKDTVLFLSARVDDFGSKVVWDEDIELAGDNLRAEAVEQSGDISHERIWEWIHRNSLTLDAAAEAIGVSRRMLSHYRDAEKRIPKHIWLACLGWKYSKGIDRIGTNQ